MAPVMVGVARVEVEFWATVALVAVALLVVAGFLMLVGSSSRHRGGQERVPGAPRPPMATRIPDPPPPPVRNVPPRA